MLAEVVSGDEVRGLTAAHIPVAISYLIEKRLNGRAHAAPTLPGTIKRAATENQKEVT